MPPSMSFRIARQRSHQSHAGLFEQQEAAARSQQQQQQQQQQRSPSMTQLTDARHESLSSDEEDCLYESMSSSDGGSVSGSSSVESPQRREKPPRRKSLIRTASPTSSSRKERKWKAVATRFLPPIAMKRASRSTTLTSAAAAAPLDVEQYMTKREMTPTQERWNAVTMIPSAVYCVYFLLTAQWLSTESVEAVTSAGSTSGFSHDWGHNNATLSSLVHNDQDNDNWSLMQVINQWMGSDDADGCLDGTRWWHFNMPALPPLPVLAIALGICLHAPFSFLYHWTFAHRLPPKARSQHWSRRMDQSMIHVCSTCLSYAVTGSVSYLLLNVLYNADCCRRQFRPVVRPKLNQIRIFISMLAYTVPLLVRGEVHTFVHLWMVLGFSGWFFVQYPVGGWSHAVFHVLLIAVPPILFQTATLVAVAEPQLQHAATCAALYHHEFNRALVSTL